MCDTYVLGIFVCGWYAQALLSLTSELFGY